MHDVISVKNVSKSFGTHCVLRDFSVEIPLCGVTVLRGASGAEPPLGNVSNKSAMTGRR